MASEDNKFRKYISTRAACGRHWRAPAIRELAQHFLEACLPVINTAADWNINSRELLHNFLYMPVMRIA